MSNELKNNDDFVNKEITKTPENFKEDITQDWQYEKGIKSWYIDPEKNDIILIKELWEIRRIWKDEYIKLIRENLYIKWYSNYYLKDDKKKIIMVDMDGKNIHRHLKRYTDKKIWLMLTGYEKIYLIALWIVWFMTLIVWYFTYSSYSTFSDINTKMTVALWTFNTNNSFKEDEILTNTFTNKVMIERFWLSEELQNFINSEKAKRAAAITEVIEAESNKQ